MKDLICQLLFWLDICEYNTHIMACTKIALRIDSEPWNNLFVGAKF